MTRRRPRLRVSCRGSISYAALGLLLACPTIAAARPEVETSSPVTNIDREALENLPASRDMQAILDLHNNVRAEVGSAPLRWNQTLADGSQAYANVLAQTGAMQHASRAERGNASENLIVGPASGMRPVKMAQIWVDESQFFHPGAFPNVCDGDWSQCGHYSQMIWSTTTDLGCGYARDRFIALVCRYTPQGNTFGQQVLGVPPNLIAQGPVINVNNPPPPANPPQAPPGCQIPEPDDFITLLNQAAIKAGFGIGAPEPGDETTDRHWQIALDSEKLIQDRLMKELATLQGDVAQRINEYLAATSAWQETYVYLSSTTTGLQGLLTNWLEAREIYEKADLAFALANLGVGGVKLGFKAYKFFTTARSAASGVEAAAGATRLAGAADEAVAAGSTGGRVGEAAAAGETGVAAAGETQAFNRTLIPPGQNPNVLGMGGYTGASSAAGRIAESGTAYARAMEETRQAIAQARAAGKPFEAEILQGKLDRLIAQGASGYEAAQAAQLAGKVAELDQGLVAAAREAGVNVEAIAGAAADAEAADLALMNAIAKARGWHDIPAWAADPISNILINSRKMLAGAADAKISPQDLELLKSLKTYVESRGLNFAEYLASAAGEVGVAGKESFKMGGLTFEGKTFEVLEGIVKYYDAEDINLLLKALESGGDAAKLRTMVSPVTQASLNGLGRAGQALGGCGALDTGLTLQGIGGTTQGLTAPGGTAPGATAPGGKPTDAQLANVLNGTGKLGEVGLGNVIDQFGVTDRFTEGQSLPRAMAGELWEFITSPSTTTASFYYTLVAQDELLNLLQNEKDKLLKLGSSLDDASRALQNLQNTLQRAGLSGPGSYLGSRGPDDLRRALDNLESIYNSGSDTWKKNHKAEMDARRDHINQKLSDLAETVADLNALAARMQNLVNWLDSLRKDPTGGLRGPVDLFNPAIFVRLGSISLYLRGMGADAFGLTSDVPFRVVVPPLQPQQPRQAQAQPRPQPANAPVEDFDTMKARLEAKWRALDEMPETEVDPDFDAWLNSLPPSR